MARALSSALQLRFQSAEPPPLGYLKAGEQLDHYYIGLTAARGGLASVYRARDLRNDRVVALKVPHREAESNSSYVQRLLREEEICLRLDHPSVIKVFRHENGSRPYLVMEWVEGKTLRQLLDGEYKLQTKRAVTIAMQICDALEYVHGRGIVHHDLKPENIMVCAHDAIKIIDFGIAAGPTSRGLPFVNPPQTSGTPDYISPEQVRGKRGDARSDIYATGTMLYEMLTGQAPFSGFSPLLVMNARLFGGLVPPSQLESSISPRLEEIICRALEKEPRHRYGLRPRLGPGA